jgi:hypothetical protein
MSKAAVSKAMAPADCSNPDVVTKFHAAGLIANAALQEVWHCLRSCLSLQFPTL